MVDKLNCYQRGRICQHPFYSTKTRNKHNCRSLTTSAGKSSSSTLSSLLCIFLLECWRIAFAFLATRAHYELVFNWLFTLTP